MTTDPAPTAHATPARVWALRGAAQAFSIQALVLYPGFVGFAVLAREAGFDAVQAAAMTVLMWALPSMVLLVGAVQSGATLAAAALAVTLSAVRLMPMTATIVPVLRAPETRRATLFFLAHFVAVTGWVIGMLRLPALPPEARAPWFAGCGLAIVGLATAVTVAAHSLAGALPVILAAALVFLTPLNFVVSLWTAARVPADRLALVFGLALAPALEKLDPDMFLLWTGLIGGTAAYLAGRLVRRGGR